MQDMDNKPIQVFDVVKWRSKGRGVITEKTGCVLGFVPSGEMPKLSMDKINALILEGKLPAEAEWAQVKFRQNAVPRPTFLVWAFFTDICGNKHHGFYRPMCTRVRVISSTISAAEQFDAL